MLFGEYELSPGLIGLSLLPTPHPEAFQRLSVRPSIPCYRDFSLDWGRSPGFASAAADLTPCSDSLSLRLRASSRLTSPATATRRLIMQKARRHPKKRGSDSLWAHGFRDCFTPLQEVLFTFPSRYWFTIGLRRVFSLGGWSRRIHTGFHVPRATQEHGSDSGVFGYGTLTLCGLTFQTVLLNAVHSFVAGPTTPVRPEPDWFGLCPVRSPLLGVSRFVFSSSGY